MSDPILFLVISAVFVVSLVSLIGVVTISAKKQLMNTLLPFLVALAAGTLLGNAVIHLIPESFEVLSEADFAYAFLVGILVFFVLEKALHWHHKHHATEEDCVDHSCKDHKPEGYVLAPLVILADAIHNILDGVVIAAGFMVSIEVGIATTIAVVLHEIPQEISDFSLLVHSGMSRFKALLFNFGSALTAFIGALTMIFLSASVEGITPYVVAATAGAFIYIAIGDLIPILNKERRLRESLIQVVVLIIGLFIIASLNQGHAHEEEVHDNHAYELHLEETAHHDKNHE